MENAIRNSTNLRFYGRKLTVRLADHPRNNPHPSLPKPIFPIPTINDTYGIMISPVPSSIQNNRQLIDLISPYSTCNSVYITILPESQSEERIGFVSLANPHDEPNVVYLLNGKSIGGQKLNVQRNPIDCPLTIQFKGFQSSTSKEQVFGFFKTFGEIDPETSYYESGSGFIHFISPYSAQQCFSHFDKNDTKDDGSVVSIFTNPKGKSLNNYYVPKHEKNLYEPNIHLAEIDQRPSSSSMNSVQTRLNAPIQPNPYYNGNHYYPPKSPTKPEPFYQQNENYYQLRPSLSPTSDLNYNHNYKSPYQQPNSKKLQPYSNSKPSYKQKSSYYSQNERSLRFHGFSPNINEKDIKNFLSGFGNIINLQVINDPSRFDQYVDITFETTISTQMCYDTVHSQGLTFNGSSLDVHYVSIN